MQKLILILTFTTVYICIHTEESRITEIKGAFFGKIVNDQVLDIIANTTLLQCAIYCKGSANCQSYFWNNLTKTCQRQSTIYTTVIDVLQDEEGSRYFVGVDEFTAKTGKNLKESICTAAGYDLGMDLKLICYKVYQQLKLNYENALQYCEVHGGRLFRAHTLEKFMDLQSSLIEAFPALYSVYIDGTDALEEGIWRYSDGSLIENLNVIPGQPEVTTQDQQDCINLYSSTDFQQDDVNCADEQSFVCELVDI